MGIHTPNVKEAESQMGSARAFGGFKIFSEYNMQTSSWVHPAQKLQKIKVA